LAWQGWARPGGATRGEARRGKFHKGGNKMGKKIQNSIVVEITRPKREIITVHLKSVPGSTLICHRKSEQSMQQIKDKQLKKAIQAKEAKNVQQLFEDSLYRVNGVYGFPAPAFKAAMVQAANLAGMEMTFLRRAGVYVLGEIIPFYKNSPPKMREDFPVIKGVTHWRIRSEFESWGINLKIQYNANVISKEQIIGLLDLAGFHIGIGDWRPFSPKSGTGNHGMWEVAA
jgi:hypothetical protein